MVVLLPGLAAMLCNAPLSMALDPGLQELFRPLWHQMTRVSAQERAEETGLGLPVHVRLFQHRNTGDQCSCKAMVQLSAYS